MRFFTNIRSVLSVAPVLLGLTMSAPAVKADDYGASCEPVPTPVVITTYKTVCVPDVRYVTKYDHCGRSFKVRVVFNREVKVSVRKVIYVND